MGRRGANEGSIYRQRDGLWAASLQLGYENGKRVRKYFYGTTQQEVQQKRDAAKLSLSTGQPISPDRTRLGQYLDQWLETVARRNTRPKTYLTYRDLVELHLKPGLGGVPLGKLGPQEIQKFINRKIDAGLSLKTVKHIRDTLRNALNVACREWQLIPQNPATKVRLPRIPKREMRFLTLSDARVFIDTSRDHELEALFEVALLLGMRQGELLGLRWPDIDFEQRCIKVQTSLLWFNGKFHFAEPKSEKGRRTLPLPEFVCRALLKHRATQDERRLAAGSKWQERGLVFPTSVGTPMHRRNVLRKYYRFMRIGGLPEIRFHDLRHSAAAIWISQGASPKLLQVIMGHADFATTMNLYGHLFEEVKRETADRIGSLFEPVAVPMAVRRPAQKPN